MKRISLSLPEQRSYTIVVDAPLEELGAHLGSLVPGRKALVVSVPPVWRSYGPVTLRGLRRAGFQSSAVVIPDGESHKTLKTARRLYDHFLKAGLDRKSVVVALGGGVVGDTAGFAAATFMRGVPVVQCPTTLLAMVDASIGGKTGVDLPQGKNLVGAFWQPRLVWMDLSVLKTLPDRQWRTGIAEVIKYGLIADLKLLKRMEEVNLDRLKGDPGLQAEVVQRSVAIKARVVAQDERETRGVREILNLGHTFGHAVESVSGFRQYTHGEAIAVGFCAAARLGVLEGVFPRGGVSRVENLLVRWGLPVTVRRPLPRAKILGAMSRDKKTVGGTFRFVLPEAWAKARGVGNVPKAHVIEALRAVGL